VLFAPEYRLPECDEVTDQLTATISWGDGATTPAEVLPPPGDDPRGYLVRGVHTYSRASSDYEIVITIRNQRTGVEHSDRHYRGQIRNTPRLAAYFTDRQAGRSALLDLRVSKTTTEVGFFRNSDLRVRLPRSARGPALGHVKLTTNGVRRTLTLRARPRELRPKHAIPLLRRSSGLSVQLRLDVPFLRISRIPRGTTRIIVHFRDAGRGVLRLASACPARATIFGLVQMDDEFLNRLTADARLGC
jgi:hypothetical protein